MKRFIISLFVLLLTAIPVVSSAQASKVFKETREIASIEKENGDNSLMVFFMPEMNQYYLCVGNLGIGDDVLQFNYDPIFDLFIPLGETLENALARLEEFKTLVKQPDGTAMETIGCLAFGYPNDELEPVTVSSYRVLLGRKLMFSVKRGEYIRATHIPKADISAIVSSVKFYRRLHPKEK